MSKFRYSIRADFNCNNMFDLEILKILYREAAAKFLDVLVLPNGHFPQDPSYDYDYLYFKLEKDLKKLESEMQKIKVSVKPYSY